MYDELLWVKSKLAGTFELIACKLEMVQAVRERPHLPEPLDVYEMAPASRWECMAKVHNHKDLFHRYLSEIMQEFILPAVERYNAMGIMGLYQPEKNR